MIRAQEQKPLKEGYKSLKEDYKVLMQECAEKQAVVDTLAQTMIENVDLKNLSISDALRKLNEMVSARKDGQPINVAIRTPTEQEVKNDEINPFGDGTRWSPRPVTLHAAMISWASAIDQACNQAGYQWWIDVYRTNEFSDHKERVVATLVLAADWGRSPSVTEKSPSGATNSRPITPPGGPAGADQPATKPADKVPADVQPPAPTPKDAPR